MARYYNLAHDTKRLAYAADYLWPFDIDICFDPVPHPIAFSEGVGHASAGCTVSASEALEPKWREHFDITNGQWIIPYIEKLIQGLPLPQEEMTMRFKELHGKPPECYQSRFSPDRHIASPETRPPAIHVRRRGEADNWPGIFVTLSCEL